MVYGFVDDTHDIASLIMYEWDTHIIYILFESNLQDPFCQQGLQSCWKVAGPQIVLEFYQWSVIAKYAGRVRQDLPNFRQSPSVKSN